MKVLVTGAGGFLGRHLAVDLARRGFAVVAACRNAAPPDLPNPLRLDLATADSLPSGIEAVVHAAATSGSVDESTPVANPDVYGMTKLLGEAMLGEAAPGMSGLALRLPAVIGPGAKRNFLAEAARKLKAGQEVSIFNPDAPFNNAVHCADLGSLIGGVLRRG